MTIKANFTLPAGATVTIPYVATKADGTPFDFTGMKVVMSLSAALPAGGNFAVQKSTDNGGVVVTQPTTAGLANIYLYTADTRALVGVYYYDVVAIDGGGNEYPLSEGIFIFTDHPNR